MRYLLVLLATFSLLSCTNYNGSGKRLIINQISPTSGPYTGGTVITISGDLMNSSSTFTFGGTPCIGTTEALAGYIYVCATAPHLPGFVDVVVTNSDGTTYTMTNGYYYQPPPSVTSISPTLGAVGGSTVVTITGTNFLANATVAIGGSACGTLTVDSATQITCTTSAHATGIVDVVVTNTDTQTGTLASGYFYGVANSWSATGGTPPTARYAHTAIWDSVEMIVWGGRDAAAYNDGKRYVPSTDTWSAITNTGAPSIRFSHTAVWTGTKMIVWGGNSGAAALDSGGLYDPIANSWTSTPLLNSPAAAYGHTAVWTGTKMIVWGGYDGTNYFNTGAVYDPSNDTWATVSTTNAPAKRAGHVAVWNGSQMIVWGGYDGTTALNTGGIYNPTTNTWTTTSTAGALANRAQSVSVWNGIRMLVWGGQDTFGTFNDGSKFNPAGNAWTTFNAAGAPTATFNASGVWTGSEFIVWGGEDLTATYYNSGGKYNSSTDAWSATAAGPAVRSSHSAVWTGAQMIVWGGKNGGGSLSTGSRYVP